VSKTNAVTRVQIYEFTQTRYLVRCRGS